MAEPKIELVDGVQIEGATRLVDECYDYTDNDQIGEGTYGKVYRGTDKKGEKVALKMIRMDNEKEGFPITAIREIKLLSTLKHENIVNLREIVRSRVSKESKYKGDIFMVFDYAEHDLTGMMDAVKHKGGMSVPQIKCVMQQLLQGLSYCHQNGILHRDLKASNLLINKRGVLKIADFGLARNFANDNNGKLTNRVITLWYRPPELLLGAERYGPEVDVWSVGCIFAELLAKRPLFPGNNEQQQLDCIFKLMGAPSEENWPGVSQLEFFPNVKISAYKKGPEAFDQWCRTNQVHAEALTLLKLMLQLDPSKRISALDASLHPYFYETQEPPCQPNQLPRLPDCHEWTTKKRKHNQQQHHAPQAGYNGPHHHPAGGAHYPGHHSGAHPGGYSGHMGAAAAAGGMPGHGYGGGRGPHDNRSVRPRTSGTGSGAPPGYGSGMQQHGPPPLGYNPAQKMGQQQQQQHGPGMSVYGQQGPAGGLGYQGPKPPQHGAGQYGGGGYGQQQQQQQQHGGMGMGGPPLGFGGAVQPGRGMGPGGQGRAGMQQGQHRQSGGYHQHQQRR